VIGPTVDGGGGGGGGGSCTPPTSYANLFVTVSGHTQAESDDKVSKAWSTLLAPKGSGTIYYDGPGSDESYVEDLYNGDVLSEGMSYGMMIAVQLDHQTEFDRIWTWVKNKLWSTATPSHNYWDGVLYMLGMVHISGKFHIW
jgi:oligosaccharide reducing-end xylanase